MDAGVEQKLEYLAPSCGGRLNDATYSSGCVAGKPTPHMCSVAHPFTDSHLIQELDLLKLKIVPSLYWLWANYAL